MAVNEAPNLGTKRRRRRGKSKTRAAQLASVPTLKARAVGLRRRGGAPASDFRSRRGGLPTPPRPAGVGPKGTAPRQFTRPTTIGPRVETATSVEAMRAAAKARKPASSAAPTTTPTTGVKPPKPAVPAGQPPAYGARRKPTLPPGLAKRTGSPNLGAKARPSALPRPPKRPKRPKAY